MKHTVKDFIYKGGRHSHLSNFVAKLDPLRCAFDVAEHGRITDWHQCTRKPVEEVDGYKFCKVHAREVKRKLGREQEFIIRYVASFSQGQPFLAVLKVVRETLYTIDIAGIEPVIGKEYGISTGFRRKDGEWMRKFEFFNTANEAHQWLLKRAENSVVFCKKELEKAEEVRFKLSTMGL